jgi:hypothetical protein
MQQQLRARWRVLGGAALALLTGTLLVVVLRNAAAPVQNVSVALSPSSLPARLRCGRASTMLCSTGTVSARQVASPSISPVRHGGFTWCVVACRMERRPGQRM